MINIKQLPQINVQLWPNVIHMGYMTEVIRRMGLEWNQETPCPAKLQNYLTAVQTAFQRVSPADEVDSEKEYGLVAYEHESEEENENN